MRIAIDNLDGRGSVDYTGAIAAEGPVTIQRVLNAPSRCTAEIVVGLNGLALPVRRGRVVVTADRGAVLFTGYLATEPVRVYAGEASEGAVYRARVSAVSDEWLLDKQGSGTSMRAGMSLGMNAPSLLGTLATRVPGSNALPVQSAGTLYSAGAYAANPSELWSVNAGAAAGAAYAGYRAQEGSLLVQTAGTTVHALSDADGSLQVDEFALANLRELANDVTLSGEEEPTAYVSECFLGDGTTSVFELSEAAYRDSHRTLLEDNFSGKSFDRSQWVASDPASALAITSAGLTCNGGTGVYGATALTSLDELEIGGSLVAELGGVVPGDGADGVLAGFFNGSRIPAACFAGLRVRQQVSGGASSTVLVAVVNGAEVGNVFTPVAGHSYTLRVRLHSVEMQRQMQSFYVMVDGAVQSFGDVGTVGAPVDAVFELLDEGAASNTPATVLYDSYAAGATIAQAAAVCSFVPLCAAQMHGSVGSVRVTRPGSLWVTTVLPSGAQGARLVGVAGQGVDCEASYGTAAGAAGKVTFFAGRVPVANERVTVSYRARGRSVARLQDAASVAAEAVGGGPGTCRWLGKVVQPKARSSADCEAAALAVLAMATSRNAAIAGTYVAVNPAADVWPGDVLAVTSASATTDLMVRQVEIADEQSAPEVMRYRIRFANDWATEWADGLGMKLSESIAADAWLPTASSGPPAVLDNLRTLGVTAISTTSVQIDAGVDPPSGGGFEVRRRDWAFGAGVDAADLVLRSPVRSFSIPRAAQVERFYVRMYDGSSPAVYSRWSSVVMVHAPVS